MMKPDIETLIREVKAHDASATAPPWFFHGDANHLRAASEDRPADCTPEHEALFSDPVLTASTYPGEEGRVFVSAENMRLIERYRTAAPLLAAEVERLDADNVILSNANISLLERAEKAEREVTFGAHLVQMHLTARDKAQARLGEVERERDKARATAEELRLTLAAEQGRAEGAPSLGWSFSVRWHRDVSAGRGLLCLRVGRTESGWAWFVGGPLGTESKGMEATARAAMQAADAATATHP